MLRYVFVACALLCPAAAVAQNAPAVDVSGGYSWLRDKDVDHNFHGWLVSAAGHLRPWFAIAGEVGGNYKTIEALGNEIDLAIYSFMTGPRFSSRRSSRVTPFAHVLVGAVRKTSRFQGARGSVTEFAVQPGGGLDVWFRPRAGIRVGGDYRRLYEENADPLNEFRFHVGIVIAIGGR